MRIGFMSLYILLISVCLLGLTACSKSQPDELSPATGTAAAEEHGHEGPHGGHVIELGSENHHVELTHDDDSPRVAVYVLDGTAKMAAPIDAESVVINVSVDGKPTQYTLPAVAQPGDPPGKSSYFELESGPLHVVVSGESEAADTHARISITIDGKPYVGLIETEEHDHDHDHDH